MARWLREERFHIHHILEELASVGATAVPCLEDDARRRLLAEAEHCELERGQEVVGSGARTVRQQLSVARKLPAGGPLAELHAEFQALMDRLLADVKPYPFETALTFNEATVQRYEGGSIGITPHRDRLAFINLVSVFNLGGQGRFYVCADRAGTDTHSIDAAPGRVILMRAPGFRRADKRPFHGVDRIEGPRHIFALRQLREPA